MSYPLNTKWILWHHSLRNKNWNEDSYVKLFEFNNLYDYYFFRNNFDSLYLQNSMFFLMRDDIFPTWENKHNKNGGSLSYKVPLKSILSEWFKIIEKCITEDIHVNKNNFNLINGLSITPKKEFNILKIWIRNNQYNNLLNLNSNYINKSNQIYKKHF